MHVVYTNAWWGNGPRLPSCRRQPPARVTWYPRRLHWAPEQQQQRHLTLPTNHLCEPATKSCDRNCYSQQTHPSTAPTESDAVKNKIHKTRLQPTFAVPSCQTLTLGSLDSLLHTFATPSHITQKAPPPPTTAATTRRRTSQPTTSRPRPRPRSPPRHSATTESLAHRLSQTKKATYACQLLFLIPTIPRNSPSSLRHRAAVPAYHQHLTCLILNLTASTSSSSARAIRPLQGRNPNSIARHTSPSSP